MGFNTQWGPQPFLPPADPTGPLSGLKQELEATATASPNLGAKASPVR